MIQQSSRLARAVASNMIASRAALLQSRSLSSHTLRTSFLADRLPSRCHVARLQPTSIAYRFYATHVPESRSRDIVPDPSTSGEQQSQLREPSYQLTFTCKPCSHRSSHLVTKHGYHKGTVLVKCPSCSNRHVISDHLRIFMDEKSTLEDILKRKMEEKGEGGGIAKLLKKGTLGRATGQMIGNEGDEDIEFWDDGTTTSHNKDKTD